jgi:hypothetical protein
MTWGPAVSGLVGGLLAAGLVYLLRGQVANVFRGRLVAELVAEYRSRVDACGVVFIASLGIAVLAYSLGWVQGNDWRPLTLAFGAGPVLPIAFFYVSLPRERFAEFWVAVAAKDGLPQWVANVVLVFVSMLFAAGVAGLILGKGY